MANYKYKVIMKNGDIHYADKLKNEKTFLSIEKESFFTSSIKKVKLFDVQEVEEKKLNGIRILITITVLTLSGGTFM